LLLYLYFVIFLSFVSQNKFFSATISPSNIGLIRNRFHQAPRVDNRIGRQRKLTVLPGPKSSKSIPIILSWAKPFQIVARFLRHSVHRKTKMVAFKMFFLSRFSSFLGGGGITKQLPTPTSQCLYVPGFHAHWICCQSVCAADFPADFQSVQIFVRTPLCGDTPVWRH